MTQDIRERLKATPFVPFTIATSDGRQHAVPHPDFAFVSPKGTRVEVWDDRDLCTRIPILHISGVSDAPKLAGSAKRPRNR